MKPVCLAVVLAVAAIAGCRTIPPPPPIPRVVSADELLHLLKARQQGVQSFQARGRLTLLAPGRSYSGPGRLRGSLPSTLRVDVLDFFGRSLLNFASDGQRVEVLVPREGKLFYGPATPSNLAAFVPPGVTLTQALKILTADLPLSEGPPAEWRYDSQPGVYLLEWRNPDGSLRERLQIDGKDLYPVKEEWYGGDGKFKFAAELSDYHHDRPQQIKFKTATPETELRLAWQEMQLNPAFSVSDLKVPEMPGVEKIPFRP
uniref:DUF4292 domain-containing protein n=1 Tax=Desulfobacca acetoxidans TaxID=60893 RepID=A0A7C3WR57_9BACT